MAYMEPFIGTPPEPPAGYKYVACRYCEKPIIVRTIRKKSAAHIECSLKAQAESIRQITNKEGPHYQHWLAGQRNALDRLSQGAPPHDDQEGTSRTSTSSD